MNVREISLVAIIAALYAALVIILVPISFGPIQLRIADCLIPFSAVFGWPAIIGVTIGAFIGNMYFFLSPIDLFFGASANLLAAFLIFSWRKNLLLSCVIGSLIIGSIVGGYLWLFFPPPDIFGITLPMWAAMIISITLSSLIVIVVIGYVLVKTLKSIGIFKIFESKGIKIYSDD
ncbi:QueT transporter family protein [Candidatus Bathyarchaeota archaeon]|nr:QueT transporter family protein [Candidatus Bathyarchaeota archaeon]